MSKRDWRDVVEELGVLSDGEIYELLKSKGVRGVPGSGGSCPIARYLLRESDLDSVLVGTAVIPNWDVDAVDWSQEMPTPNSVLDFMGTFDNGLKYSDLSVEEETE